MLKGPAYGKVDVYLDDVLNSTIDLYNVADLDPQIVLTLANVPLDIHRVKVVARGDKNGAASAPGVSWYALEVMR
jgi:hypothetical protein